MKKIKNEAIIGLLQGQAGFVSGAEIAGRLGVTRAAVWKTVNSLKRAGYRIEASRAKGYRLTASPDLSVEEIRNALSSGPRVVGREIVFFDSIDSTNTAAGEFAVKGYPEGTVVIANSQTGGKGRRGRTWVSPPDRNLYISIILTPDIPPTETPVLTLMTAVACATALRSLSNTQVSIKWPNDLMASGRKLGGILTEIKADADRILHAIIGIGLNVNLDPAEMPDEIRSTATSIKHETGRVQSRTRLAVRVLEEMERWYALFLSTGKGAVTEEWLRLSSTIGRVVKVTTGGAEITGTATGITEEGMLILRLSDDSTKRISAGDVIHCS